MSLAYTVTNFTQNLSNQMRKKAKYLLFGTLNITFGAFCALIHCLQKFSIDIFTNSLNEKLNWFFVTSIINFNGIAITMLSIVLAEHTLPKQIEFLKQNKIRFLYSTILIYTTIFLTFLSISLIKNNTLNQIFQITTLLNLFPFFYVSYSSHLFLTKIKTTIKATKTIKTRNFQKQYIKNYITFILITFMTSLPFWLHYLTWYSTFIMIINTWLTNFNFTLSSTRFMIKLTKNIKTNKINTNNTSKVTK